MTSGLVGKNTSSGKRRNGLWCQVDLVNGAFDLVVEGEVEQGEDVGFRSGAGEFEGDIATAVAEKKHRLLVGGEAVGRLCIVRDVAEGEHISRL